MADDQQKDETGGSASHASEDFAEFEQAYDERLSGTLDLDTWTLGEDVAAFLDRTEQEIADAIARETSAAKHIREIVFPQIASAPNAPRNAGVYQARRNDLE